MASQSIAGTIGKVLLGIVVLIIIVYFFFANSFIKAIAEKEIGNAHGAQVDIASIDHTLFPITITIDGIEITDAHAPKFNQIQVGQVKADVEFIPLLSQKVIVDNVLIDKVAFSQLRAQAGDVYRQPGPSLQDILDGLPSKDGIPTKDELLARSALQTPEEVKAAKETKAKYIEPLQAAAKSLPTKADIAAYKAQFNTLKQTNFNDPVALLNATKQWDGIKAKIKTDKTNIQEFNALASTANTAIKAQITLLQSSTKADYQLLQGAIVGDSDALAQMTQMVFGAKAQQFNKTLLMVINTVTPMFATKPDEPVTAIDLNAKYPNLLVKQAQVNLNVGAETITSQWQNITDQHMITNIPTTFDVQASNGKLWQALTMSGNFEILANGINAQQQWDIAGLILDNLSVSDDPRLQALIETASLFSKGSVTMKDNVISGAADFVFDKLTLQAQGSDEYTKIIAETLSALDSLTVTSKYSGDVFAPVFSLKSDLDNRLGKALVNGILADQAGPLAELRQSLQAQAAEGLGIANSELGQITQLLQLANGDLADLEGLLSGELGDSKQIKDKLLDKLKGKLFSD
jgi:uncharacterized protein (TIGR03545 family)